MKKLGIIVAMAVAVVAYKDGRGSLPPLEDFPPYQGARKQPPFHEQHQPFREQFKSQLYQSYRQRPYSQDLSPSYSEQLPFRDQSLLRDYPSGKSRRFYGDSSSVRDAADLKRQTSFYLDGAPFKDQQYRDQPPFRNEQSLQDQPLNDQYSYLQPSFRDDFRFSDLYDKPISSLKEQAQPDQQTVSYGRDLEYLKHGNHGLGYVSVPPISPYENALPLNEQTPTTAAPSSTLTTTQKSLLQSSVSSTAIAQVHTSATSEPKTASHTATMPTVKSDTLVEGGGGGASTTTAPTISAVTSKESSNLVHPTGLTTSLPVVATESPILSFGRHTVPPIEFQSAKFTTPASYYVTSGLKSKLQQSLLSYLLSQQAKGAIKSNDQSPLLNYALPDVLNNSFNNKIQSQPLSYVLPGESKAALKDNLLNYLLQPESNRGLSFQPSSLSETVNYVPLASTLADRSKLTLPSIPMATLSAIPRPLQTMNYIPPTLPRVSPFIAQDSSSVLPLGAALPSNLAYSIPEAPSTGIFNSLPGGISGISAGMPGNMSPGISASIPTLNLGQNFQHIGQVRQFEAPSQPLSYSTGLQLQLGGFGGLDYTLPSSSAISRPMELGIAKVGFSLPEIPRQQFSTFPKIGLGQHMW
ncbi:uncharacterized protein LOC143376313 isoform X2 [Andrena cerasifolii]|uniref:uncharacterized protein LOC143376313 isoform X2 n=1 Tax=Andrena cerasifolii TaxID=2819439 RepID=UPI004038423A